MHWFELGLGQDSAGRVVEAAASYQRAVELRPAFGEAWHNLGEALLKLGDGRAAAEAFTHALALLKGRPEPSMGLSRALRQQGDSAAALAVLEALARDRPDDARVWNELGILHREHNELSAAIGAYRRALAADQHNADAHHNLGNALAAKGDLEGAIASYRGALAERPGFVGAMLSQAAVLSRLGRSAEAVALCERALAMAPKQARTHLQLGHVLSWSFDRHDLIRAEACARGALALEPARADAQDLLCLVLRKLGRGDDAIRAGVAAVRLAPQDPQFRVNLAAAILSQPTTATTASDAVQVLEPAVAAAPDHALAWRELGIARLRAGDPAGGHKALARAASLDPYDQTVTANRIFCLEALGERDEAAALAGTELFLTRFNMRTPAGWPDLAAFNGELAADIRAHPTLRFQPVGLAARGGSLAQDLLSARTPAIDAFERWLRERIAAYADGLPRDPEHPFLKVVPRPLRPADWKLSLWATLLDGSGEIATHIHEQSWLSGAYYVAVPPVVGADDAEHAGWFEHGRPAVTVPGHAPSLGYVLPEPGLLILFPSYLHHRTVPFAAAGQQRISISFDLTPPTFGGAV
jgi:uncharacterized protein (TIGR02466 family)